MLQQTGANLGDRWVVLQHQVSHVQDHELGRESPLQLNMGVRWPPGRSVRPSTPSVSSCHPATYPEAPVSDLLDRITIRPDQCGGRPCIRGMRIRVIDVLEQLAAGASPEEILEDFPYLEPQDIAACLQYAARRLDHPTLAA